VTGTFFNEPTVDTLTEVLAGFDERDYDPDRIRAHALTFDVPVFKERLRDFVESRLGARVAAR